MRRLSFTLMFLLVSCAGVSESDHHVEIIAHTLTSTVQIFVHRDGPRAQAPAVGRASAESGTGRVLRAGSGVVVHSEGAGGRSLVLTAKHLVSPLVEQSIAIVAPGRAVRKDARVVAVSDAFDLALLEVAELRLTQVDFKPTSFLGDAVWVVAFPWGRRRTVVTGVVSQIEWGEKAPVTVPVEGPALLIDAPVSYGTSGGGVYDVDSGLLIGVVRGYRTAEVTVPGAAAEPIRLPVAGETTVVPAAHIAAFLTEAGFADLVRTRTEESR